MKKRSLILISLFIALVIFIPNRKTFNPFASTENEINEEEYEHEEEGKEEDEHETGADKQLAAWFQSRAYPDPYYLNDKYEKAWYRAKEIRHNQAASRGAGVQSASWQSIGPSQTIGGRILSIAIDPNNSNNLFIGSAGGGIWKSTNAGGSWSYVNVDFPVVGVSSIVYHPTNSSILLAGTGEVYRVDTSNIGFNVWKARGTYGIGILRSTDGGASWSRVFNKLTSEMFAVMMIKYDPSNSNNVFACATDGLYKSTDGGVNWTKIYSKIYVNDIAIHPTNSNIMVISVGNLVNADKGIYRTTDGGSNWTKIGSALPSSFDGYIKIENLGSSRLYASVGGPNSTTNELFLSTDFGATWVEKSTSSHCGGQYWFGHDLAIDPNNQDKVIMGGVSYYSYTSSSTTTGSGTRSSFASSVHADVHDIEFAPGSSTVIYIACDGGMYKTTNGSTFSNINSGLAAVQFYASIATSPTNPDIILGGLQDNGVIKYDGTSWTAVKGGDGGPCAFHPTNGNIAILSNDARAVFYSSNAGTSSSQKLLNLGYGYASAYDDRTAFMSPVAISKSNPNIMYAASDNLHISTDGGATFQRPDPTNMTRPIEATYKTAISLAVSPTNPDKVYVSTSPFSQRADDKLNVTGQPNVLRSLNASNNSSYSFTSIKGSLPDRFVMDFAISKNNDDSVYVVLGGFGTSHVYLTANGGTTWTSIGTGLPDVPFNAILIDPTNPKIIYAGGDLGVYVSPNRGATWYDFNNGFWENVQVMDLQATSDNQLVAATHGKGVFLGPLFSGTLPVSIVSFTGEALPASNKLQWQVAQEVNVNRYEIERSEDNNHFQKIGTVTATNAGNYNYNDLLSGNLSYYYRLKSIDVDGSFKYSDIIYLKRNIKGVMQVVGNPFTTTLKVQLSAPLNGRAQVNLYGATGQLLRSEPVASGQTVHNLNNLGGLPAGTYFVEVIINNQRWRQKVLKK